MAANSPLSTVGARMVDISDKTPTLRTAVAVCRIHMQAATMDRILSGEIEKGNVIDVAKVAGIAAAKQTPGLLPLCHPLQLTSVEIRFHRIDGATFEITAEVKARDATGVEMEALTSAAAAALTVYDMCKSIDRDIVIGDLKLLSKTGGRSGTYQRQG